MRAGLGKRFCRSSISDLAFIRARNAAACTSLCGCSGESCGEKSSLDSVRNTSRVRLTMFAAIRRSDFVRSTNGRWFVHCFRGVSSNIGQNGIRQFNCRELSDRMLFERAITDSFKGGKKRMHAAKVVVPQREKLGRNPHVHLRIENSIHSLTGGEHLYHRTVAGFP
jgi:hypothetical protein